MYLYLYMLLSIYISPYSHCFVGLRVNPKYINRGGKPRFIRPPDLYSYPFPYVYLSPGLLFLFCQASGAVRRRRHHHHATAAQLHACSRER